MSQALKTSRATSSNPKPLTVNTGERRQRERKAPGFGTRRSNKLSMGLTKLELIENFRYKVRFVAVKLARDLPASTDLDDLISTGFIGLMDAAEKFDPTRGVKFETYAEFRIRGAILDDLRKQDWMSRTARDKINEMKAARENLESANGALPSQTQMSERMHMPLVKFQEMMRDLGSLSLVGLEDLQENFEPLESSDEWANPFREAMRKEIKVIVEGMLDSISEQERMVLNFYYYRGLTLREVSMILSVSESRVSQIHTEAVKSLRKLIRSKSTPIENLFIALIDD
jgi:RNA polymerase sigma factor for flagellar operon FliA